MRIAAVPVLLVALLAGCADRGPDPAAAPAPDPVALIGNWRVTGTDEEEGTVLRLAGEGADLSLWRPCGMLGGRWRADGAGIFLADVPGTGACPPRGGPVASPPTWLARAAAYRLDGADRELLDAVGRVVARLVKSDVPAPVDTRNVWAEGAKPPVVTDRDRQALAPAAPLPAGVTPITAQTVAGRWVAADGVRRLQEAHIELSAGGEWSGSDGCNGEGGRWVAGAGGTLLATSRPMTTMGCDNHPAGTWLYQARSAAIDGEQLIFFDRAARELGRLRRG